MEVPVIAQEKRDFMGADVYGRMRSPWNVNDSPYLVRGLGEMCGIASTEFCELCVWMGFFFSPRNACMLLKRDTCSRGTRLCVSLLT